MSRQLDGYAYAPSTSLADRLGTWPKTTFCACGKVSKCGVEGFAEDLCYDCLCELATWPGYEWLVTQHVVVLPVGK